jgi:hypothetical protein
MRRAFEPTHMHRTTLIWSVIALPCLILACSNIAGDNGLDASSDGYIPIPLYEAGPPPTFDGSFDAGDAADVTIDGSGDGHTEGAAKEAGMDGPTPDGAADGPTDGPHEGASSG